MQVGCAAVMYLDLDEPRADADQQGSDLRYDSRCGAGRPALTLAPGAAAGSRAGPDTDAAGCAQAIRTSPLGVNADVPVQKGTVLCVLTSAADAEERGERPRMVLVEVTEVGGGHGQHAGHLVDRAGVTRGQPCNRGSLRMTSPPERTAASQRVRAHTPGAANAARPGPPARRDGGMAIVVLFAAVLIALAAAGLAALALHRANVAIAAPQGPAAGSTPPTATGSPAPGGGGGGTGRRSPWTCRTA